MVNMKTILSFLIFVCLASQAQNKYSINGGGSGGASLPSMAGNAGKTLSTNGNAASWAFGNSYNILNYGCVGDSATDNTAALQALINLAPAGSTINVPGGVFKVSSVVVNKPLRFAAATAPMYTYGGVKSPAMILGSNGNAKLFDVQADYVRFENLAICTYDTAAQTTGALIYVKNGTGFKVEGCYLYGGYNDIDIESSYSWQVSGSTICGMKNYGLLARDVLIPDEGDAIIESNWIFPKWRNCHSLIRQESGGGIKVSNNKFNNSKLADGGPWWQNYCYSAKFFNGFTVLCIFNGNSFENFKVSAIKIEPNGNFGGMVVVTGNQSSSYNSNTLDYDFSASAFTGLVVSGNVASGGTGCKFIDHSGVYGSLAIGNNSLSDYTGANEPPITTYRDYQGNTSLKVDYQGMLIPSLTKITRDATAPHDLGRLVFVSDNGGYLSWWDGSAWRKSTSSAD